MKKKVVFALLLSSYALSQHAIPSIGRSGVEKHIRYLASEKLEGRKTGTIGAQTAAKYIAEELKSYGLRPLGANGTYLQPFEFTAGIELRGKNAFQFTHAVPLPKGKKAKVVKPTDLILNKDFRPIGISASSSYKGAVVFAGYGISASDKSYDDYANIDVKDKAVIVLRYSIEGDIQRGEFSKYTPVWNKVKKAKELGAAAVIIVTGPVDSKEDELMKLTYDQQGGDAGLPVLSVTRAGLKSLLSKANLDIQALQEGINSSKKPNSLLLPNITLSIETGLFLVRKTSENVVAVLDGNDAQLKNEAVVVGAHYDHLGFGGEGSGSLQPDTVAVHNGADDNASGTAGLLELAKYFANRRSELKRSMVFISFSGEEMGLLGSAAYVKNPTYPLEQAVTMLNMDMIGRLKDRKLIVYGIGTSGNFESIVRSHNIDSTFDLKLNKDGFGPSDHSSFYGKNIPVFHFFTDLHSDYHRPSDDADKINFDGEATILGYVAGIAYEIDTTSARPAYLRVEMPKPAGGGDGRSGARVYTGTIPDFGEQVEGMKLAGVREGGPAAKAGLLGGDIIIKFGKVDVKSLQDYTYALGEYKVGDSVEVTVLRGAEKKVFTVVLEKRSN